MSLGVRLFDTSRKNAAKLTPAGKLFYKFFVVQIDNLNKTIAEARALNNQDTGEIKIACIHDWDMSALIRKINKYPQNIIDKLYWNII
jgi:DNA-binding transcriptional LysR family regulator